MGKLEILKFAKSVTEETFGKKYDVGNNEMRAYFDAVVRGYKFAMETAYIQSPRGKFTSKAVKWIRQNFGKQEKFLKKTPHPTIPSLNVISLDMEMVVKDFLESIGKDERK